MTFVTKHFSLSFPFLFFPSSRSAFLFVFSYFFTRNKKKPRVTFPAWANFARSLANRDKHFLAFPHLPLKNFTRLSPRTSFPSSFVDRLEKYLFGGVFPFLFIWRENEKPLDDFHLGLGFGRFFLQNFPHPFLTLFLSLFVGQVSENLSSFLIYVAFSWRGTVLVAPETI